jgi:hypothetical protein
MEGHRETAKGSSRTVPIQQDFLFVDAAQAKTSRQGRKNARSFVMQKARRERPWSTSKHAAKQRKASGSTSTSPRSAGTPDSLLTPKWTTPSPTLVNDRADYFTFQEHTLVQGKVCPECQIFLCRPGQSMCPRCVLLNPAPPVENVDNSLFDPFETSSVEINASVSELLEHCEYISPYHCTGFVVPKECVAEIQVLADMYTISNKVVRLYSCLGEMNDRELNIG